jgi:hypothetical protein
MKWILIYFAVVAVLLVWNYSAGKINKRYDEETPNKD